MLSALFSGSEIAFVSANKLGVEVKRNQGFPRGRILARFFDKPKAFISTMLVGNNIALVIFTYLMTKLISPLFTDVLSDGVALLLLNTVIITIVVLIVGEFLPKTLFRLYANDLLYFLAYPLAFFKWLLAIPTWIMTVLSGWLIKYVFKAPEEKVVSTVNRLDLEHFIQDSISETADDVDKTIMKNALNLSQIKVRDCMVPRTEMVTIDRKARLKDLLKLFKSSKHSRILVVDGDVENVVGYIHHQQLLKNPKSLKKLILDITYAPEAMNVQDLLLRFIKSQSNIACVVDEYGGTAGLITLEDILEEIFGEIEDEHDVEDYIEKQISDYEYLFSGRLEIDYLNDKYELLNFPQGEYVTLSGLIVMTTGNIPENGAEYELNGYRFILEHVSNTKIETVRVKVASEEQES